MAENPESSRQAHERAQTDFINHLETFMPLIDEACGLGLFSDPDDGNSSSSSNLDLEEELAAAHTAFQRDYIFHSTETRHPKQPSHFETIVLKTWLPSGGEDLSSVPERDRWYNRRWVSMYRLTYECFCAVLDLISPLIKPDDAAFGDPPTSAAEKLAVCLYFLGHGGVYGSTSALLAVGDDLVRSVKATPAS